jgi:hypothetical protein
VTYQEFSELHARYEKVSQEVDTWFIEHSGRTTRQQKALVAMLDARSLAEELLRHTLAEAVQVQHLRGLAAMNVVSEFAH